MKTFDLVLFGATGFTGRLVAAYLLQQGEGLRLALAGRDEGKLRALASQLRADVDLVVADASDPASLDALVGRTRAVCTTVGPYAKYGDALVAAAARAGVDYCDLTGEAQWVRRMIDAHHEEARRTGARIVHCCGFDSIPSDLGTFMLQGHARQAHGAPCTDVTFAMRRLRGAASGGTIASMFTILDEARRDRAARRALADPYSLVPGEPRGPDTRDVAGLGWDPALSAWTGPFVMAAMNAKMVRRTNALLGYPYGRDFRYREVSAFKPGAQGLARAVATTAGLAGLAAVGGIPRVRRLLERRLPKPGEGPSEEAREKGFFEAELLGRGTAPDGRSFVVRGRVFGQGDPGYAATARMLGEAASCLALDERRGEGGVLTPASALGDALLSRLRRAGMVLAVDEPA